MKRALGYAGILVGVFVAVYAAYVTAAAPPGKPPIEKAIKLADGVWFEQHNDIGTYGSNVGWIEFADFVAVVDTAFPRGAEAALKSIKATTRGKPIRYAIVTHYHADHSFGTGVFAREGALIVAHENARREYLSRNVAEYGKRAATDKVAAKYKAFAPNLTFADKMVIDDGKGRLAELYHFGHAHTTGCIFTWLPREKVVFTGDATVNGPFNYMGDSDSASWIDVITQVQTLAPEIVVPGHGPAGKRDVLDKQKSYFVELRAQVGALVKQGRTMEEVRQAVEIPAWKAWTGESKMNASNVDHVYRELTRGPLSWHGDPGNTAPAVVALPMDNDKERPKLKFLTGPRPADEIAGIKQLAPNVELVVARDAKEAMAAAPQIHGATGNFVTPAFLRAAENLRWVQQFSAGVEQLVSIPELVDADRVVLTNMKAMFGPNIADHVFALLLPLVRAVPHWEALKGKAQWGRVGAETPPLGELKDRTMLLVGLGGIGREVARRAHAFGMRVVATDPKEMAVPVSVARLERPEKLRALLPAADVVVVAAPLTPQTTKVIGAAELALMKPTAYFINIARGKEHDNEALAAALRAGKIAGAGLDVTDPEPLPATHPLWKAPNLIITPHIAGRSPGSAARTRALFMENMRRFAAGEPLLNVVDKKAGY